MVGVKLDHVRQLELQKTDGVTPAAMVSKVFGEGKATKWVGTSSCSIRTLAVW
jgi:hypothetical protein